MKSAALLSILVGFLGFHGSAVAGPSRSPASANKSARLQRKARPGPAKGKATTGPAKKGARLRARIETYIERTSYRQYNDGLPGFGSVSAPQGSHDPIVAKLAGVPSGGKVEIRTIGKPSALSLPRDPGSGATPAERKSYDREVARRIASAQRSKRAASRGPAQIGAGGRVTFEDPVTVRARTPLEVRVGDTSGRTRAIRTEAIGEKWSSKTSVKRAWELQAEGVSQGTPMTRINRVVERGGILVGTYKPEIQTRNMFVSRPFQRDGHSYVRVFSAAAFAGNNARVSVRNLTTGKTVPFALSRHGAGAIEIPATAGAVLEIKAEYPSVRDRSLDARTIVRIDVPAGTTDAARPKLQRAKVTEVE